MLNSKTLRLSLAAATVVASMLPALADDVSSSTSVSNDGMGTSVKSSTTSVGGLGGASSTTETSSTSATPATVVKSTHSSTKTTVAPPTSSTTSTTVVH